MRSGDWRSERERERDGGDFFYTTQKKKEKKNPTTNHTGKEVKEWAGPADQPFGSHQLDVVAVGLGDLHDLVLDEHALFFTEGQLGVEVVVAVALHQQTAVVVAHPVQDGIAALVDPLHHRVSLRRGGGAFGRVEVEREKTISEVADNNVKLRSRGRDGYTRGWRGFSPISWANGLWNLSGCGNTVGISLDSARGK